jgi:hypothetical protein
VPDQNDERDMRIMWIGSAVMVLLILGAMGINMWIISTAIALLILVPRVSTWSFTTEQALLPQKRLSHLQNHRSSGMLLPTGSVARGDRTK